MQLNTKPKRGTRFIIIDTGEEVTLNRVKENGEYFVDYPNGNFESFNKDDLKPLKPKAVSSISSKPKSPTGKELSDTRAMNEFFDKVALKIPFNCQNCNKPLYAFNKKAKRAVSAHILPKAIFESVKTNEHNILFMGADFIDCPCNCHDRWDSNNDIRVSMPIYQTVLEIFNKHLKPCLNSKELVQAYSYLKIEWQ